MKIEVAGAQITDAIVEILDDFQHGEDGAAALSAIDRATRALILADATTDDKPLIPLLQDLYWVRDLIETLIAPPDVDSDAIDIPVASL